VPDSLTHITTSGGLISAAFIENVREPGSRQRGVEPVSFTLPWAEPQKSPAALEETIATAWELLLERWDAIRNDLAAMDVSQVRSRWLLPLFLVLDFDPVYQRGDTVLDQAGRLRFPLSHRGWPEDTHHATRNTAPPLHTVPPSQSLDARTGPGGGIKVKSPHDMLQAFLNASADDRWAVLSNGVLLRLLRDYHHTHTRGYVQFDLEAMFETRNYGDFRALCRLCHASRFVAQVPGTSQVPGTLLEQFYKDSIATGVRVGEDLREQVRQAIETLGNGFLDGALIGAFHGEARDGRGGADAGCQTSSVKRQDDVTFDTSRLAREYYAEILHIVYRVLFLLFAEQRGMMPGRDSLYAEAYSIAHLRALAEGDIPREDDFTDLWHGLQVTFRMVREGVPELGVFGYDGMLFAEDQTPLLSGSPPPSQGGGSGRGVRNSDLLRAVRALTLIERDGVLQRISYADLGVEELGSIYESLLDFTPRVTTHAEAVDGREIPANTFFLDPRGSERKTTGSYYTHDSLVDELIKSALLPVARDRLARAGLPVVEDPTEDLSGLLTDYAGLSDEQRAAGEEALLGIKVCDPAVGSGHFLVKANDALGAELARVCTGDEYPTEAQIQAAKRDVLAHCIYAVDVNPMAVELCKVSLWINASVRDKPLSFLDHHIKCGNSLIGATPELMDKGVPYEAFAPGITGNDRDVAKQVRAQSRQEQREFERGGGYQPALFRVRVYEPTGEVREVYEYVGTLAEDQPRAARERYAAYLTTDEYRRRKLEADCWTAAFFWPLTAQKPGFSEKPGFFPTCGEFIRLRDEGPEALPPEALAQIETLAERYRFFHWHLEFPDVFPQTSEVLETSEVSGGFDVVLGNPPWEQINLVEKEFFADKVPEIVNARTGAERRRMIEALAKTDPELYQTYLDALRESEAMGHFFSNSGRYPLAARGRINLYQVFAGTARRITGPDGRAGIVVPSGIATDYYNQDYFNAVVEEGELVSFYDFENRAKLFPEVDSRYKFCLLTLTGGEVDEAEFAFFLHTTSDLANPERRFGLSREEVALMNPNTGTVPVFRTRRDAELTEKLYYAAPVLVNKATGENPWGVSFKQGLFNMTNDSHLFRTREELEAEGFVLEGNRFVHGEEIYLPLYEAKMFHRYDHRYGTFEGVDSRSDVHLPNPTIEQYQDSVFVVQPWYWVAREEVITKQEHDPGWFLAFRDIARSTDERTGIFSFIPWVAVGNNAPILTFAKPVATEVCGLASNLNALAFDFVLRQKIGGIHLNFYVVEQLPILPPDRYTPDLLDFIVPRVVELTYTAWDLQPFARDVLDEVGQETWARWFESDHLGSPAPVHTDRPDRFPTDVLIRPVRSLDPPPFVWDEERRAVLRAELDALYGHLYGLTREELAYILDTFPIVRRKDEARYGEYRTKRMVLESYEALEGEFN